MSALWRRLRCFLGIHRWTEAMPLHPALHPHALCADCDAVVCRVPAGLRCPICDAETPR